MIVVSALFIVSSPCTRLFNHPFSLFLLTFFHILYKQVGHFIGLLLVFGIEHGFESVEWYSSGRWLRDHWWCERDSNGVIMAVVASGDVSRQPLRWDDRRIMGCMFALC